MNRVFLMTLLVVACLSLCAADSFGQAQCTEDPLVRDSVRVIQQIAPLVAGDTIYVPIDIWNDEAIQSFSLGFNWDSEYIRYAGATMDAGLQALFFTPLVNALDTANNNILLGCINLGGGQIPATAIWRNVFTVKFVVEADAQKALITVDSTFVPPAAPFILAKAAGGGICPEFLNHPGRDILLPVQEYDTPVLPQNYALSQNQPNPFNPTTTINFALPRAAKTRIEIYNILGQKVTTLVDEYLAAGNKRVEWNGKDDRGNDVASGVYLYRMTANDYSETKKMMLMK